MTGLQASITIGIDPTIELGPVTLAWHGLTIAIGIAIGLIVAGRRVRRRGLPTEPLQVIAILLVVSALAGSRIFYLAEHGQFLEPSEWLGTHGLTYYGGLAAGRLIEFFARSDSATTVLGLETAQWTSLVLIGVAVLGAVVAKRVGARSPGTDQRASR